MKWIKRIFVGIILAILCLIVIIVSCNCIVTRYCKGKTYSNVEDIPYRDVGLLLGTSPYSRNGGRNIYFTYRIDAAVKLYKAEKIRKILISGDGVDKKYDEPKYMRSYLIERGIPASRIILDKKGLRTYDSVKNAKDIYGLSEFTVISQKFHNERTIFLAGHNDIDAIGFNAKDAPNQKGKHAILVKIRETFAKVKVFIDLYTPTSN